jgi:hypothetical protein
MNAKMSKWSIWHLFLLIACVGAMAAASSSKGGWTEGMKMEDYTVPDDETIDEKKETIPTNIQQQIPCGVIQTQHPEPLNHDDSKVHPLETILDTTVSTTTITWAAARENDLLGLVDWDGTHFFLRPKSLWLRLGSLEATVPSPAIRVLQAKDEKEEAFALRLGLDFFQMNQGSLDSGDELFIDINGEKVMIPFIRPRPSFAAENEL